MPYSTFCNYSALKGRFIKAQGSALGAELTIKINILGIKVEHHVPAVSLNRVANSL